LHRFRPLAGNRFAQQVNILAKAEVKIEHLDYSLTESITCGLSVRDSAV
jgi:hypothetical protein